MRPFIANVGYPVRQGKDRPTDDTGDLSLTPRNWETGKKTCGKPPLRDANAKRGRDTLFAIH